ncbi:hypothetical protein WMY93_017136 [Mugilogobius chulae]|uniref:L1 transposable element RRM domain-containing protein n=1 Tax=Mugilogobius chulae TaxID=88201 RepID=A0AAW0NRP7_9GOBI
MPRPKGSRKNRNSQGPKMDLFLTATTPPPAANESLDVTKSSSDANNDEATQSAADTRLSHGTDSEDFPSGLSDESVSFLREVRRMIQEDVQEEIRKVGADVLTIKDGMNNLTMKVDSLGPRVTEAEARISRIEDDNKLQTDQMHSMVNTLSQLQSRLEYYENYSRRNNLRLRGVPEGQGDGQNETDCIQNILKCLFKDTGESVENISIERAHRVPTGATRDQRRTFPRYIVVRFLRFTDREKVRLRAMRTGNFLWNGAQVDFFPDFTKEVQEKRRRFAEVKRACAAKGLRYSMQFPAILWINIGGQRQRFEDPTAAQKAIDSQQ